jgi:hypothetical protein
MGLLVSTSDLVSEGHQAWPLVCPSWVSPAMRWPVPHLPRALGAHTRSLPARALHQEDRSRDR